MKGPTTMTKRQSLGALALMLLMTGCNTNPSEGKVKASVTAPASTATTQQSSRATEYTITSDNSELSFVGAKVTAQHNGSFRRFRGDVRLVEGSPEKSSVKVEVDMASVAIEPAKLEGHLKSPDFFDVAKYPKATFQSTSVKPGGAAGATHTVTGNLTLHGTTKSVSFPATIQVSGHTLSVNAEFSINRKDFGIVYPGMPDDLIREDVLIRLRLGAKRS